MSQTSSLQFYDPNTSRQVVINSKLIITPLKQEVFNLMEVSSVERPAKRFVAQVFNVSGSSNYVNTAAEVSILKAY